MKRSIISLCVFVLLVVIGVSSEAIYTSNLANEIDKHTESFNGTESCRALSELFESRKIANRIFLKEGIVERFEVFIRELDVYIENGNSADAQAALEKIKYYTKDLHEGRAF